MSCSFVSSQYWLALGLSSVFCFIFKDISVDIKCNSEAAVFCGCMFCALKVNTRITMVIIYICQYYRMLYNFLDYDH